jgi:flagellar assembly protein FliH
LKPNSPQVMPSESSPSGLAGFNLDDISRQAHQRLESCRDEVSRMLEAAKLEAEQLRVAATAEGLAKGREQAASEADKALQAAVQKRMGEHAGAVKSMMNQIATQHQSWIQNYADSIVTLVIEVSERVIRARLDREPEILVRWAADALAAARSAQRITVAVHPETLAELGKDLDELLATPGLPEDSVLVPDETVARTGVVVRQLGGNVDAGLETHLDTLQRLLEELT